MIPLELLDTAQIPGDAGEVRLYRRGEEYSIRLDGNELMNSHRHGSEEALAEIVCARLKDRPKTRVLVGGLGMGCTLRAALDGLGPGGRAVVAELVQAVVRWNRGPVAHVAGRPLDDRRASVYEGDVAALLRAEADAWDAVVLDVDNGPEGLTHPANDWLYGPAGLAATSRALKERGILGLWSAGPDHGFTRRLRKAGFQVEEKTVRAHGGRGARHVLWIAVKGDPARGGGVRAKAVPSRSPRARRRGRQRGG